MNGFLRPLGGAEQLMWMADRISPLNFILNAEIEGELTIDAVRAGVEATVKRYPALAMSIGQSERSRPTLIETDRPISIDVLGSENWVEPAIHDLNRPFDCPHEPLMRIRWLRNGTHHHLMVTLHHSIADGRAGLAVLDTLLTHVNAVVSGQAVPVEVLGPGRPMEERHISSASGVSHPVEARGERFNDATNGSGKRQTLIFPWCFNEDITAKLKSSARKAGCTVHGLLSATHLQAIADEHGTSISTLSLSSPMDLRGRMNDYQPGELGLFVGNSNLVYRVDPQSSPWSLARRVSGDIKRASLGNAPLAPNFDGQLSSLKKIYDSRASTAISNLGVISLGYGSGALKVQAIHFAVACSTMGDQIVTTAYHGGRMTWCFCPAVPTISRERAKRIAQRSVERLMEATELPAYL